LRAISACLLGVACRYDGGHLLSDAVRDAFPGEGLCPICPEQMGGLPTPRPPAELVGGDGHAVLDGRARVIAADGTDVTRAFVRGAEEVVALCARLGIQEVLLKARSPSCGCGQIHCGAELVPGDGVAAALLRRRGFRVQASSD